MRMLPAIAAVILAGCTTMTPPAAPVWQQVATESDRERLREWRTAFTRALEKARAAGHGAEISREGRLLEPDAAVGGLPLPNGDFRCRVIKVGAKNDGLLDYVAYPYFRCRVEPGGTRRFTKLTGSQRHVGNIYPGDQLRELFLGTVVLGDETRAYQYGVDQERDLAGWIERIDDRRWRMLLPYPHYESIIDVIELVPEQ